MICESVDNEVFQVDYDKLVIAVGVTTNTFGIDSIKKAAEAGDSTFFLKQLRHAKAIRSHIIDVFEKASLPTVSEAERRQLLSFVVVGGGPTSCEFTAELHDFVKQDVKRLYSDMLPFVKITIVEAGPALLGPFGTSSYLRASPVLTIQAQTRRYKITHIVSFESATLTFIWKLRWQALRIMAVKATASTLPNVRFFPMATHSSLER